MDDKNITKEELEINDAFDSTPDEVISFITSSLFDDIFLGIQDALTLTEAQLSDAKFVAYELILRTKTMEESAEELIKEKGYETELAAKILFAIDQEIIQRILKILETDTSEEGEEKTIGIPTEAPSPTDIIARLNEKMTKPTVIAPTKRDYSAEVVKKEENTQIEKPQGIKSIDPYREIPGAK